MMTVEQPLLRRELLLAVVGVVLLGHEQLLLPRVVMVVEVVDVAGQGGGTAGGRGRRVHVLRVATDAAPLGCFEHCVAGIDMNEI